MAYTPINWQTGDTITAEKLNKCDNGWSVEESSTTLCEESVTTADDGYGLYTATLAYSTAITASQLTVTLNGTEYTVSGTYGSEYNSWEYGAMWSDDLNNYDFSTYSFALYCESGTNTIYTESAGTYTIKIATLSTTIEVSDDFQTAVNNCVDTSTMPMECVSGTTTYTQMSNAFTAGRILFFKQNFMYFVAGFDARSIEFFPTNQTLTVSWSDGVFTVTTT